MLDRDTFLQNRYRVEDLIAEGGMGAVYRATDARLNNTVALKECRIPVGVSSKAVREKLLRQFEREARLLATLRHPALPKVIDHFTENNGQFLVMEYIPGDDLLEMIERRGNAFPTDEVLDWADQLLDALEYLHKRKPPIFHRDIKPQNIKLTDEGKIVLLDFGLAKWEASSVGVGTVSYAPIEQIMNQGTDQRSDLFSLAATMYHLMTGLQAAPSYTRFIEPPDRLRSADKVNRLVPTAIADILTRALSLDRKGRPESASEMRRLLRDARNLPAPAKSTDSPLVSKSPDSKKEARIESLEAQAETIPYEKAEASSPEPPLSSFDPDTFTQDLGDGVSLELIRIGGGTFIMGSPDSEEGRWDDEGPQHRVEISPFYMGNFQVTQAQWRAVATTLPEVRELELNRTPRDNVNPTNISTR